MEENMINTKKIAVFSAVAIIISYGISALSGVATAQIMNRLQESFTKELSQLISTCSGLATGILNLAAFLIIGHILTKDKRKTFIFAGSMYFGKQAVAIITSLISAVLNSLMYAGVLYPDDSSRAIFVTNIIFIPAIIFAAYFIYTALEGINNKVNGSLNTTEMTLSRARKRYIAYTLIGSVIVGIIGTAPNLMFSFMVYDTKLSMWSTVIGEFTSWLSSVLSFAILFFVGYKAYKSLVDGMAFGVCSGVAGGISGIFTSIMSIPVRFGLNYLTTALQTDINPLYMTLISVGMGIFTVLTTVITIGADLIMLKYFFPPMKIALFSEQAPLIEGVSASDEELISQEEHLTDTVTENDTYSETEE